MVDNHVLKEYMQDLKADSIRRREDLQAFEDTMRRCQARRDEREQLGVQRLREEIRDEVHQLQRLLEDTVTETQESTNKYNTFCKNRWKTSDNKLECKSVNLKIKDTRWAC